jgi:quercetin dioxygenase-like cupin family protein
MKLAAAAIFTALAFAQPAAVVIPDLATAKWEKDDSILLRQDAKTGAMELLVRYPGGKKLATHAHKSTEHMVLIEGKMTIHIAAAGPATLTPGGVAIVPAGTPHSITCSSDTRCTFYLAWDPRTPD